MRQMQHKVQQGDIFWVDLPEALGHEQQKQRPVIVISNEWVIKNSDVVKVVPVTSQSSDYPLHLDLPNELATYGQAMPQHERSIDLSARNAKYIETCTADFVEVLIDEIIAGY